MDWQTAKHFKEPFIQIGWELRYVQSFPHLVYASADTETKLYYNGHNVGERTVYKLYKKYGQAWCKTNLEVRAYAYTISDGKNFALFQNIEDFLTCCAMFNVKTVIWYNAKFDFALFDYYFLTNDWTDKTLALQGLGRRYGKLPDKTFSSLNGDFGQRYQMQIWKEYKNRKHAKAVHKWRMIDLCNIYGGGLARNLADWDIRDEEGKPVRKLEMDYDEGDIESDLQYMINDTKGLHLLAIKVDKTIKEISGYSLFKGDYITAGGLAKKCLLGHIFGGKYSENKLLFKTVFPISVDEDSEYRDKKLYLGGKCMVNPYKRGIVQRNVYKYDVNSMYPNQMRNMQYPVGRPKHVKVCDMKPNEYLYVMKIKKLYGTLKPNMIPIWQDVETGEYREGIVEFTERYIWLEELEELKQWYDVDYEVVDVLEFVGKKLIGAIDYVDKFYNIKCNSKGAIKNGAKLFLNSAYGKLAQRIERKVCVYELADEGYVHLVEKGVDIDEDSMLSVLVGSRVTALSRVHLLSAIRDTSKGNVAKNFIYCDTDSVHTLCEYDKVDNRKLGWLKNEGVFDYAVYIAPKSYLMYDGKDYEVHCKGVNTKVVKKALEHVTSFEDAIKIFKPNKTFKCLAGLNVKGGKALLYVDKVILNDNNLKMVLKANGDLEDPTDAYGEL